MKGVFIPEITVEMLKSASLEAIEDFFSGIINDDNNDEKVTIVDAEVPQWIPCSERLPEDYTDVLVWFEYFRYGNYNRLYQMYGIGSYSSQYDSWLINQETGWNELKVFAWMPLPEPARLEETDG